MIEVGSIVKSIAGRDLGTYYLVLEILDDRLIKVADGNIRILTKSKVKNIKHVKDTNIKSEVLAEKIKSGKTIFDKELKKVIKESIKEI